MASSFFVGLDPTRKCSDAVTVSYTLYAFVARATVWEGTEPSAPLRFGLSLVPVTPAFAERVRSLTNVGEGDDPVPYLEFVWLTRSLADWGARASLRGPVAYLESEVFDDVGYEAAVVWEDGRLVRAPERTERGGALASALRELGVTVAAGQELEAAGLAAVASSAGWTERLE